MMNDAGLTPLMKQYSDIKNQFNDALVFFQVGDFYELFFTDAQKASSFLGIVLTQRGTCNNEPIPLCGVPRHAAEHYIVKLIKGGFRVVLCDQLEVPQPGKLVQRGVTQVFTPGTLIDTSLLESKSSQYLCGILSADGKIAIAFYELLTASIYLTEFSYDEKRMAAEISAFMPQEIIIAHDITSKKLEHWFHKNMVPVTLVTEPQVQDDTKRWLASCVRAVASSSDLPPSQAHTAVLDLLGRYIKKHAPHSYAVPKNLLCYRPDEFLQLDASTQKHLELVATMYDGAAKHSLFYILDDAVTGMGSRLIKKWLLRPLVDRAALEKRLDRVEWFVDNSFARNDVRSLLKKIGDLERTVGRIAVQRASVADYRMLRDALGALPLLQGYGIADVTPLDEVHTLLKRALNDDSAYQWTIASGYHEELDRLRLLAHQGVQAIVELERKEQQNSGISSLKIRYSSTAGYAIEVTKMHADALPHSYIKVQSLTNRERFTTQELKDLAYDIEYAEKRALDVEQRLFQEMVHAIQPFVGLLQCVARDLAQLDLFSTLAHLAITYRWCRPFFTAATSITINEGRHPSVEARMRIESQGRSFIPNSTLLRYDARTWIITGPNMGGKSTYLRQTALICILAQIGSFVPASYAELPLLDRIFTRIGAGDNLAEGKSTFLVEMEETALICKHATEKSLVILDEVGRGTSTYDGLALAQAIVEYVHTNTGALCLFATHYHELTELSTTMAGVVCYHAASKQVGDSVVLLHTIVPGVAQGSFGIQVARAAQIPSSIIDRARFLLDGYATQASHSVSRVPINNNQYSKASDNRLDKMRDIIDRIDLDTISPRQACDILYSLKEL